MSRTALPFLQATLLSRYVYRVVFLTLKCGVVADNTMAWGNEPWQLNLSSALVSDDAVFHRQRAQARQDGATSLSAEVERLAWGKLVAFCDSGFLLGASCGVVRGHGIDAAASQRVT